MNLSLVNRERTEPSSVIYADSVVSGSFCSGRYGVNLSFNCNLGEVEYFDRRVGVKEIWDSAW